MESSKENPAALVFKTLEIDGARKIFAKNPWPQFTAFKLAAIAQAPEGLAKIDNDGVKFTVANGAAEYLKIEDGQDGASLFELVEGQFEQMPEDQKAEAPAEPMIEPPADHAEDDEEQGDHVDMIDTRADVETVREPRKTFGQLVAAEVRAAHLRQDATGHAALHNFDIALGDFKRAAQQVLPTLPKDSELAEIIESIVSDL